MLMRSQIQLLHLRNIPRNLLNLRLSLNLSHRKRIDRSQKRETSKKLNLNLRENKKSQRERRLSLNQREKSPSLRKLLNPPQNLKMIRLVLNLN
jgi:hypothetical protein